MSSTRPLRTIAATLPLLLLAALALAVPAARSAARSVDYTDRNPVGSMTGSFVRPGGFEAVGWTFDPDAPTTPLVVTAFLDGTKVSSNLASAVRGDVGRAFPTAGAAHGFAFMVPIPEGPHSLCLWATNVGPGTGYRLGCINTTFDYGPVAALDQVGMSPGAVHVRGWAWDNDNPTAALPIIVSVDATRYTPLANLPRPDKASVLRGGVNHGFDLTVPAAQGPHRVCIAAHNLGYGTDTSLGCQTVVVDDSPGGGVNTAAQQTGKLHVTGWAYDLDQPATPLQVVIALDGTPVQTVVANIYRQDVAHRYGTANAAHGFDVLVPATEGTHTLQVTAVNVGLGSNRVLTTRTVTLDFTPKIAVGQLSPTATGAVMKGWAFDPDTSAAIPVRVVVDGQLVQTLTANGPGYSYNGHWWTSTLMLASGVHRVCAYAVNVLYGTGNSPAWCSTLVLALRPVGGYNALVRMPGHVRATGWAVDPDAPHAALPIAVTLDGVPVATVSANGPRADVATRFPSYGSAHGIDAAIPASDGEHTVCLVAKNIGPGSDTSFGCRLIIAVHPVAPSAPQNVTATPGYGGAVVTWQAPASDGGAPATRYEVISVPDHRLVPVSSGSLTATITGLRAATAYRFVVRAVNVAGTGATTASPAVVTQAAPPPQTSPAPVSTSRYIRNVRGSSPTELAMMRAEGVSDALANPSGHGYMVLLDIGGQYGSGVLLSATTRFVAYTDLVNDIRAYVDGYHSAQRASAPVMIAIGTNNDINVSAASGRDWADQVVDPVRAWAAKYAGMTIAGANDIEPGFNAGYAATAAWLSGYLANTTAPFVFNGSADGCAWTVANRGCNNGWSMAGLYRLAAGAAPTRIINLPQIYNTTMAAQWKYISLTGVAYGQPRINFGGPLTEWTACSQSGGCGSMSGRSAWATLWADLQSDSRLQVSSLPYSTDLRVDL